MLNEKGETLSEGRDSNDTIKVRLTTCSSVGVKKGSCLSSLYRTHKTQTNGFGLSNRDQRMFSVLLFSNVHFMNNHQLLKGHPKHPNYLTAFIATSIILFFTVLLFCRAFLMFFNPTKQRTFWGLQIFCCHLCHVFLAVGCLVNLITRNRIMATPQGHVGVCTNR